MRRTIDWVLLIAVLGGAGYLAYTHQAQVKGVVHMVQVKIAPCAKPITYSIGSIDSRFGITESILISDLKEAETIWESPSGKSLCEYTQSDLPGQGGDVTVSLVYDNRQAATDKLKTMGIQLSKSQSSYEELKAMYETLSAKVETEISDYKNAVAAYKNHESAYNDEVSQWNQKGGAPPAEYEKLQAEKDVLTQEFANLKSLESTMNADIDTLNALATSLNQLIVQLNINATQYNRIGASAGEFEEGLYSTSSGLQTISVYEYSNHLQLVRVLAHELGHALGLGHVSDQGAIMYKLNNSDSLKATVADISELNRICASGF